MSAAEERQAAWATYCEDMATAEAEYKAASRIAIAAFEKRRDAIVDTYNAVERALKAAAK